MQPILPTKRRTCFAGVDVERVVGVSVAFVQRLAGEDDFLGVAHLALANFDLERRALDVLAHALDGDVVVAGLARRERNAQIAVGQLLEEARLLQTAGRLDGRVQRPDVLVGHFARQRHLAVRAHRDLVALAALARDLGRVRAAVDVLVGILDGHFVFAGR